LLNLYNNKILTTLINSEIAKIYIIKIIKNSLKTHQIIFKIVLNSKIILIFNHKIIVTINYKITIVIKRKKHYVLKNYKYQQLKFKKEENLSPKKSITVYSIIKDSILTTVSAFIAIKKLLN
jgi:hypothetical protein